MWEILQQRWLRTFCIVTVILGKTQQNIGSLLLSSMSGRRNGPQQCHLITLSTQNGIDLGPTVFVQWYTQQRYYKKICSHFLWKRNVNAADSVLVSDSSNHRFIWLSPSAFPLVSFLHDDRSFTACVSYGNATKVTRSPAVAGMVDPWRQIRSRMASLDPPRTVFKLEQMFAIRNFVHHCSKTARLIWMVKVAL